MARQRPRPSAVFELWTFPMLSSYWALRTRAGSQMHFQNTAVDSRVLYLIISFCLRWHGQSVALPPRGTRHHSLFHHWSSNAMCSHKNGKVWTTKENYIEKNEPKEGWRRFVVVYFPVLYILLRPICFIFFAVLKYYLWRTMKFLLAGGKSWTGGI